ncbi:hypothetical protein HDE_12029 [Halotydeus destructor]|nr:hypothetical protein HDE_12029 [Halotydeus destructor]
MDKGSEQAQQLVEEIEHACALDPSVRTEQLVGQEDNPSSYPPVKDHGSVLDQGGHMCEDYAEKMGVEQFFSRLEVKCKLHGWCYNHKDMDNYCTETCDGKKGQQCYYSSWKCWGGDGNCYADPDEELRRCGSNFRKSFKGK